MLTNNTNGNSWCCVCKYVRIYWYILVGVRNIILLGSNGNTNGSWSIKKRENIYILYNIKLFIVLFYRTMLLPPFVYSSIQGSQGDYLVYICILDSYCIHLYTNVDYGSLSEVKRF